MRIDRRTNIKQNGVSKTMQTRIKSHVRAENLDVQGNISVVREWKESRSKVYFVNVATVKCALDRSKHGCRIKMNWLVSFGAEISKLNNKLWNSYMTIILYYHQCALKIFSLLCYSKFGPLCKILCSTFTIERRFSLSFACLEFL